MRYYEDDIVERSPKDIYTEDNFRTEFRMSKAEIIKICDIVKDEMYTKPSRKMDLSIEKKVLKNFGFGKFLKIVRKISLKYHNRRSVIACKLSPNI